MMISRGEVQTFIVDETVSDGSSFTYKLALRSTDGQVYLLDGYKRIDTSISFSVSNTWKATTALYTTITRIDGSIVGRGVLHISLGDFASQLNTFESTSSGGLLGRLVKLPSLAFTTYFARNLAHYFFTPFSQLQYPDETLTGYFPKAAPIQIVTLTARDGVQTTMKVWTPEGNRFQLSVVGKKLPILMIPGASVDDQVFSCPTIPVNTVEYFTSLGYTVYVPTLRSGRAPTAEKGYTAYDSRLDVAAAMNFVHEQHQDKMYILCHCLGAIATSMGLLDGTLPSRWIQGLTASQIFFTQQFSPDNALKARTSLLSSTYKVSLTFWSALIIPLTASTLQLLGGSWFPITSTPHDPSILQRLFDQLLRFYPVGPAAERCTSTVCHRCSLVFGRLWNHANLTHATHAHLVSFFGGIHMNTLAHLMRTGNACHSLDNAGNDLVTEENLARLRGVPIQFISGGSNAVYTPVSTSMGYDMLRERFGTALYKRVVVGGYGHLDTWMGKRSQEDVYPIVREHVEWCESLEA